ncbi:MAG: hypothetical protein LBF97_00880 [Elusimicrobiota bacterium]|jgi:hypothetical protein|nr:hypothetical protein [Elusimicrobiota bacterium]
MTFKKKNNSKSLEYKDGISYFAIYDKGEPIKENFSAHKFIFDKPISIKLNDNVIVNNVKIIFINSGKIGERMVNYTSNAKKGKSAKIDENIFKKLNAELWNKLIHFKKYKETLREMYDDHDILPINPESKEALRHILEDVALVKFRYQGKNSHDKYPQVLAIDPKYKGRDFWKNKDPQGYILGLNTNYSKNKEKTKGNIRDTYDFAELLNGNKLDKYKRLKAFMNDELVNIRTYLKKNIKFIKKMKNGQWVNTNFEELDDDLKRI